MIALRSSLPASASPSSAAPVNLHARLAAATEALLKTKEQVVEALDHHLAELDSLRRSLGNADKPLLSMVPAAIPTVPAPLPPQPEIAATGSTTLLQPPPMTQVLWPTKNEAPPMAPSRGPLPASSPFGTAPIASPLAAFPATQPVAARDMAVDPNLEKATLEELNAALAYAFNHVAKARAPGAGETAAAPLNGHWSRQPGQA